MNRYDMYPGDYMRDTAELSLAEDGAYLRLMNWCYANERSIDDARKFAITRALTDEDKRITQWVLSRFFICETQGEITIWRHARIESEIAKARPRILASRNNGKTGGRPPKQGKEKPTGFPGGLSSRLPAGIPSSKPTRNPDGEGEGEGDLNKEKPHAESPWNPLTDDEMKKPTKGIGLTRDRDDVKRLHSAWKKTFGLVNHSIHTNAGSADADTLAQRIDVAGIAECLRVLKFAPDDGMVSGRTDRQGEKHDSIGYIFGNETAFARISRAARQADEPPSAASPVDAIALRKARTAP